MRSTLTGGTKFGIAILNSMEPGSTKLTFLAHHRYVLPGVLPAAVDNHLAINYAFLCYKHLERLACKGAIRVFILKKLFYPLLSWHIIAPSFTLCTLILKK